MAGPTKLPLVPKVTITKNDASTYVFDPFTPSYGFKVRSLQATPPFDATGGRFKLTLTSTDATNAATNTILSNISEGNEILIGVGKTAATNIFRGVIEEIEMHMINKNYMDINISGPDWGSDILKHRVVTAGDGWVQAKTADGETLDTSDTNVLIEQIAKDYLQQEKRYAVPSVSAEDQGIVVDSAYIIGTGVKLSQHYANYEYLDDKLSELDAFGGFIHYVDPAKNFVLKQPGGTIDSPPIVLLTDDTEDSVAASWGPGQTNIGYIAPGARYKKSVEHHVRQYIGIGGDLVTIDQFQETDASSDPTFTGGAVQWLAVRILPTEASSNIEKIGLLVSKEGSPTDDLILTIIEDNQASGTSSKPLGQTIIRTPKPASTISTSANWEYWPVVQPINAKQLYWLVLEGNGDASNYYKWHKNAGTSHAKSVSSDGLSWTTTTGTTGYCFRQFYSTALMSIYPGTGVAATDKHFHEAVIRRPDITEVQPMQNILIQEGVTGLKRKEILQCKIYAPDVLLFTGQTVRVRIQQAGLVVDSNFIIGEIEYVFDSSEDSSTGTFYYDIQAATFTTFS